MSLTPDYTALDNDTFVNLLWSVISKKAFNVLEIIEVKNALISIFSDELSELKTSEHDSFLSEKIKSYQDSILSFGEVYTPLKRHFNNDVLDLWVSKNPTLAFPVDINNIDSNPSSKSIGDDDNGLAVDCDEHLKLNGNTNLIY